MYDWIRGRCTAKEWEKIGRDNKWPSNKKRMAHIFMGVEDQIAEIFGRGSPGSATHGDSAAASANAADAALGLDSDGDKEMDGMSQQGV
jgi:hypothetical protein